MVRSFCIPGIVFLTCAFVLSFLVSISLPFLTALDITRVHFATSTGASGSSAGINQIRFGIWSYCFYDASNGHRTCSPTGHGYEVGFESLTHQTAIIGASWTRGLAVHPVATAVTFAALLLSFSEHVTVTLVSSLLSFLAALLTLIAFAIDIALLAFVRHELGNLQGLQERTIAGPGFWLTFVSLILLLLGACTVCFGRRRDRMSGSNSYPMSTKSRFWPFRRN